MYFFFIARYKIHKRKKIGKLRLIINPEHGEIVLCTTESNTHSPLVCFTKLTNIDLEQKFNEFIKCGPCKTTRENGVLKLKNENGIICSLYKKKKVKSNRK